jgi:hypothetical protein
MSFDKDIANQGSRNLRVDGARQCQTRGHEFAPDFATSSAMMAMAAGSLTIAM